MSKSKKDDDTEAMMIDAADWQARATHIRQVLAGAPDTAVAEALGTFLFADDAGKTWTYNGAAWMSWDGTQWSEGKVPAELSMQPFLHDTAVAAEPVDAGAAVIAAAAEIATADQAKTGGAAMMSETPEAAKAETPVTKEAILASVAAADGAKSDDAGAAKSDTTGVSPAAQDEKPAEAAVAAAVVSAAAKPEETTATTAMTSDTADQPPATGAGMAAAGMAGAVSSPAAATTSSPAAASGGMGAGQPAAATVVAAAATTAASSPAAAGSPAASTPGAFRATHTVPSPGMGAWTKPDPSVRPEYQLAPRTELMVVEMTSSGWARVAGSNGWTGWVDGRQLQAIGAAAPQPAAAQPAWQQPAQQPAQTSWQQPAQQPAQTWQQPAQQPAQTAWQPAQPVAAGQPAAQPQAQQGGFSPTHSVPPMGMPAWAQPNPVLPPQAQLGAGTQLMVAEWSQSGWARVVAANGWSGWVDGRMLVASGQR